MGTLVPAGITITSFDTATSGAGAERDINCGLVVAGAGSCPCAIGTTAMNMQASETTRITTSDQFCRATRAATKAYSRAASAADGRTRRTRVLAGGHCVES